MMKKSWEEFAATKLLWWVNRSLHIFGWSIILEYTEDDVCVGAYPARVAYRGFSEETEEAGFKVLTAYLADEAPALLEEVSAE